MKITITTGHKSCDYRGVPMPVQVVAGNKTCRTSMSYRNVNEALESIRQMFRYIEEHDHECNSNKAVLMLVRDDLKNYPTPLAAA